MKPFLLGLALFSMTTHALTLECTNLRSDSAWLGETQCPGAADTRLKSVVLRIETVDDGLKGAVESLTSVDKKPWVKRSLPIRSANVWFEGENGEVRREAYGLGDFSTTVTRFLIWRFPDGSARFVARHGSPVLCDGKFYHLDFALSCAERASLH